MASTLLLRIAAPLQSWGCTSKFNERKTEKCPTKSGIIGMVACALGRSRDDDISDLKDLTFGVRVDQGGRVINDFHTAHPKDSNAAHLTYREYLSDALFLVGLESDNTELLNDISNAVENCKWSLFAGRKSCPLTGQISLGIRNKNLIEALAEEDWLSSEYQQKKLMGKNMGKTRNLRVFVEANDGDPIKDMPVSFNKQNRVFSYRFQKDCGYFPVKTALNDIYTSSDSDWFNY